MPSRARRNVFHDKVGLFVTLTGVVYAVLLSTVPSGLLISFAKTASNLSEHSGADLRVAAKGLRNFDPPAPFFERKYDQALAGVASAETYRVQLSRWKRTNEPGEGIGPRNLETLIELEDGRKQVPGPGVDSFIVTATDTAVNRR
jgi:putative ABC transport system permease protein